mmetsp:Transcript_13845/g.54708  ORF Transcript_13845/g.54708 Transcript_13845/m.54708 type:complete len:289 (+) Transcript_13845:670-1536(+)
MVANGSDELHLAECLERALSFAENAIEQLCVLRHEARQVTEHSLTHLQLNRLLQSGEEREEEAENGLQHLVVPGRSAGGDVLVVTAVIPPRGTAGAAREAAEERRVVRRALDRLEEDVETLENVVVDQRLRTLLLQREVEEETELALEDVHLLGAHCREEGARVAELVDEVAQEVPLAEEGQPPLLLVVDAHERVESGEGNSPPHLGAVAGVLADLLDHLAAVLAVLEDLYVAGEEPLLRFVLIGSPPLALVAAVARLEREDTALLELHVRELEIIQERAVEVAPNGL